MGFCSCSKEGVIMIIISRQFTLPRILQIHLEFSHSHITYIPVFLLFVTIATSYILILESPCLLLREEISTGCTRNHFLRLLDKSMCFGNRSHMRVYKVAGMVPDMKVDMVGGG